MKWSAPEGKRPANAFREGVGAESKAVERLNAESTLPAVAADMCPKGLEKEDARGVEFPHL